MLMLTVDELRVFDYARSTLLWMSLESMTTLALTLTIHSLEFITTQARQCVAAGDDTCPPRECGAAVGLLAKNCGDAAL